MQGNATRCACRASLLAIALRRRQGFQWAEGQRRHLVEPVAVEYLTDAVERDRVERLQLIVHGAVLVQVGPSHADGLHPPHWPFAAADHARTDLALRLAQFVLGDAFALDFTQYLMDDGQVFLRLPRLAAKRRVEGTR